MTAEVKGLSQRLKRVEEEAEGECIFSEFKLDKESSDMQVSRGQNTDSLY